MTEIHFLRLTDSAVLPSRGTEESCGLDIYSAEGLTIKPGERGGVRTGIAVAIPSGSYGKIAPRSGLAMKYGIDTLAGIIDSDYRGEIICVLINLGQEEFRIEAGDRIAQLIVQSYQKLTPKWEALDDTGRGGQGFGSTGK